MGKKVAMLFLLALLATTCVANVMPVLAAENSWVSKAPMQTARDRLGTAVVKGKIYAIGGDTVSLIGNCIGPAFGTQVNTTEEYNPTTDTWIFKKPMPTPRCSFAIAVFQDRIYCIGGYLESRDVTGVNEVYDPTADTWQTKTPMPTPRMDLQANVVDEKIYLIGGRGGADYLNINEVYAPMTDTWSSKASPPNRITSGASAATNGRIYVLAAASLLDAGALIQSYAAESNLWAVDASSPTYGDWSTTACAASVALGKIAFFSESSTYIYDTSSKTWTNDTVMPTPRGFTGVALLNGAFYVIGGIKAPFEGYIVITGSTATNEQYTVGNDQPMNFDNKIHIRADGSIKPTTANIMTTDKIHYTFTGNNSHGIIIERDNIILNGNGCTLQGSDSFGIAIFNRTNVAITNLTIAQFPNAGIGIDQSTNIIIAGNNIIQSLNNGIRAFASSNMTVAGNKIQNNEYMSGIQLENNSNDNQIWGNEISGNYIGIRPIDSQHNLIYHNNFLANSINAIIGNVNNKLNNAWDNGYPSGGNYWSDYNGTDNNVNGIGDTPHTLDKYNVDNYPLMTPFDISNVTVEIPNYSPLPNPSPQTQDTDSQPLKPQGGDARPQEPSESLNQFPIVTVAVASIVSATLASALLLAYSRKRHNQANLDKTR